MVRAHADVGASDECCRQDQECVDAGNGADLEDDIRTSAVIYMSMIYFKRKDVAAALDVLNTYQYISDPDLSSKSDIAVNDNNRCYAYMELGALKKALADCTASLKYGSLPDAYRKQREIVKRLKAGEVPL